LRNKFRFWGKEKIAIILEREYKMKVSISTVGRILSALVKKRKIKPVAFYSGKYTPKPRAFTNHAQRLPTDAKGKNAGELVQIDHMTIRLDSGKVVKHFDATCPTSRFSVGKAYYQATSLAATNFLDFIVEKLPFPVRSIQVDGGTEFRGEFEEACKRRNIPLFVIPPRSPKINGTVERNNGTVKYEFYSQYDKASNIGSVNNSLQQFMDLYNNYRPHRGLQGRTPMEYWLKEGATQASFQSHMY